MGLTNSTEEAGKLEHDRPPIQAEEMSKTSMNLSTSMFQLLESTVNLPYHGSTLGAPDFWKPPSRSSRGSTERDGFGSGRLGSVCSGLTGLFFRAYSTSRT